MRAAERRRRGHSMLEVMVVVAITALLVLLSLGALVAGQRPSVEGSVRAHVLATGEAALRRVERELASAHYAGVTQVVGAWDGLVFTPAAGAADRAAQLFPVTGWSGPTSTAATGPAVVYQFRPRPGGGGPADRLQLVRIDTASGLAVPLLEEVVGASDDPGELPAFTQVGAGEAPPQRARLEVRFTLARQTGPDAWVRVTFAKVVTLRNLL
ncbi:MAG: prepilin-type N-terminal cleavage/methylation domain-containing protein [Planctomycetes bacterium]|nr:prepilin-type N-terminal cleavage/methylation domain-containing protein [Planctomycetota bacterium]